MQTTKGRKMILQEGENSLREAASMGASTIGLGVKNRAKRRGATPGARVKTFNDPQRGVLKTYITK